MKINILLAVFAVLSAWGLKQITTSKPALLSSDQQFLFTRWAFENGKAYTTPAEKEFRARVFVTNQATVQQLNEEPAQTAVFGHTPFSDLTLEEFNAKYTGYRGTLDPTAGILSETDISKLTASTGLKQTTPGVVDWRSKMGRARNQWSCGSCYSFAAAHVVESFHAIKKNQAVIEFSEQHIVDCSKPYGNNGCGGGFNDQSIQFLADVGAMPRSAYPYTGDHDAACKHDPSKAIKTHSSFGAVLPNRGDLVLKVLESNPLAMALDATALRFYKGGIIQSPLKSCTTATNHAVTLYGAGKLPDGRSFWRVRNSWGAGWGESGDFRILAEMNGPGLCGTNVRVITPLA